MAPSQILNMEGADNFVVDYKIPASIVDRSIVSRGINCDRIASRLSYVLGNIHKGRKLTIIVI